MLVVARRLNGGNADCVAYDAVFVVVVAPCVCVMFVGVVLMLLFAMCCEVYVCCCC